MEGEIPPRPVPLPVKFDAIPRDIRYLNQWVLWRYVWKEGKDGKTGKWDKPPCQPNGDLASSTASFTWSTFQAAKAAYERGMSLPADDPLHFDGVGFVPRAIPQAENNINFGDLDGCRDKETGEISAGALEDLRLINSYCEISPSGTGLRFIAKGNPPFPEGKAGRKKGGIELYQGGHYLTITGHRLEDYPATIEKRPEELNAFYKKHFDEPERQQEPEHQESGQGPKLTDDQIISLASQAHNSPKFLKLMTGEWESFPPKQDGRPYYPSQSEADLGLCEILAFYTTDHEQIDRIFRRSNLYREKWDREDYRQSTIALALERTTEHYNDNGNESNGPAIKMISKDHNNGAIGVCPDTGAVKRVVEIEREDGTKNKFLAWVSDCAIYIHTETRAKDDTEFIFVGKGAVDKREVRFTLPASSLAEPRKFKAALINAFGARNRVGELNFEMVQRISLNPRLMERIEVPSWKEDIPLLPGVGLVSNVEYRLSSKISASVYDGDLSAAKEILRKLLRVHRYAPILVCTILGAPAIARWYKNDRFGLGLWGSTGTLKTTTALTAMGIYGLGYVDSPRLKAGKAGSTIVGGMEIFAAAGFLPQVYDDVKTVDSKDAQSYVAIMHGVLEGEEKARGKKDGGLRDSREFLCTPIVTGEVRPPEASTTARVFNLNWTHANGPLLAEVQAKASLLPVIGFHWLRFLASTDYILCKDFDAFRSKKMEEFLGLRYTNPGRLASIYTLFVGVWQLLEASPLGDVFEENHQSFKAALEEAIAVQGAAVSEETEISRFLSGLEELIASNPGLIMSQDGKKTIAGSIIGKWMPDGLFLLPTETLNELMKIRAFNQQPTIDSITQGLNEKGLLIIGEGRHLKYRIRLNGGNPRGWYIKAEAFPQGSELFPASGNDETDSRKANVPGFPQFTREKRENISEKKTDFFGESKKDFNENGGNGGNSGNVDRIDRSIDIDFNSKASVPSGVPSDHNNGNTPNAADSFKADLLRAEEQRAAKEAHDRDLAEKYTRLRDDGKKSDSTETVIVCAVCGANLAGKSRVERNGKTYCAMPGCGYPARREARA